MKKIVCYILLMVFVVVILPFLVLKGCSNPEKPPISNIESSSKPTINVYITNQNKVVKMYLEDYLIGVVAAEMPASYDIEALKAQAIAARTYALGRAQKLYISSTDTTHNGADVCTNPGHCQAWISKDVAMKRWGLISSFKYWNKICMAVSQTSGEVIEYNHMLINPLFHSNSGGHTENIEDVWAGPGEPYLRGVISLGEDKSSEYENKVELEPQEMIKILKQNYPDIKVNEENLLSSISINKYSESDRVIEMKIGNISIKGTDFRKLFQLKSTNFKIEKLKNGKIVITTLGYGHGVGMSQCGANYLAQKGSDYKEILKYYYKGVEILSKINK